jgi:hypothetical protein
LGKIAKWGVSPLAQRKRGQFRSWAKSRSEFICPDIQKEKRGAFLFMVECTMVQRRRISCLCLTEVCLREIYEHHFSSSCNYCFCWNELKNASICNAVSVSFHSKRQRETMAINECLISKTVGSAGNNADNSKVHVFLYFLRDFTEEAPPLLYKVQRGVEYERKMIRHSCPCKYKSLFLARAPCQISYFV